MIMWKYVYIVCVIGIQDILSRLPISKSTLSLHYMFALMVIYVTSIYDNENQASNCSI
jgi:hypothetical protein